MEKMKKKCGYGRENYCRDEKTCECPVSVPSEKEKPLIPDEITELRYFRKRIAEHLGLYYHTGWGHYVNAIEGLKSKASHRMEEHLSRIKELEKEVERLNRVNKEYHQLWEPVDELVRNSGYVKLGESVSKKALELLKTIL